VGFGNGFRSGLLRIFGSAREAYHGIFCFCVCFSCLWGVFFSEYFLCLL